MTRKSEKISLGFAIAFGSLFFILYGLSKIFSNIVFNYVFWSRWDEVVILLFMAILSISIHLILRLKQKSYQIAVMFFSVFLMLVMSFILVFSYVGMRTLSNDNYQVYLVTSGFNTSGTKTIYLKENAFYSRKIASFPVDETDHTVEFELIGDTVHVVITDYINDTVNTVDIDLSLYE